MKNVFIVVDENEYVDVHYAEEDDSKEEFEMDDEEHVESVDDKMGATNLVVEHGWEDNQNRGKLRLRNRLWYITFSHFCFRRSSEVNY